MKDSVVYLGHYLDKSGLRPLQDKVDAIRQAERASKPEPTSGLFGIARILSQVYPQSVPGDRAVDWTAEGRLQVKCQWKKKQQARP